MWVKAHDVEAKRFPLTRSSSYRFKSNPRFKAGRIRNALHLRKIRIK